MTQSLYGNSDRKSLPVVPVSDSWRTFCADIVENIERIRLEQTGSPDCPTCGTTHVVLSTRVCVRCERDLPIVLFHRKTKTSDERRGTCRGCANQRTKRWRVFVEQRQAS